MNFDELSKDIKEAAKKCFSLLRAKYPDEDICGYALYSDADAASISPAANSKAHLEEMLSEDPDDEAYYRWSPGEWEHEFEGAEFFDQISKKLRDEAKAKSSYEELSEFRNNVYEACVASLEALISEGFFSDDSADCIFVFTVSDAELPDEEVKWIARLNDERKANEFAEWVNNL